MLKQYLSTETIRKSEFDFVLNYVKIKKRKKKKIDFIIYYRKHINKENSFNYNFLEKICSKNYKVNIVGDKINMPNLNNLGYISNKKLNRLLAETKFTLSSNENIFSLFNIECINNNVKIFADKKHIPKCKFLKKNFIPL